MKYTIRNKSTGVMIDVTPEKWLEIKSRSRTWEKIGEVDDEPKKKTKPLFVPESKDEIPKGILEE